MRSLTLLLEILLIQQAFCWWNSGHLIVARIAYDYLQKNDASIITRAEGVLAELAEFTTLEKEHPFVECATFADKIKGTGYDDQAHWHFVDNAFMDDGYYTPVLNETYNVTWAIGQMLDALEYAKPQSGDLPSGKVSYALGDSFNLRLLIHYVGDIHQPLHATSRFTKSYPKGDEGGNYFHLSKKDDVSNLHALWDSVLYTQSTDMKQPLSDDDWTLIGTVSTELTTQYPESSFSDLDEHYTQWNKESYQISADTVYVDIKENSLPSDEYIDKNLEICQKQLVKAGFRLAKTLMNLWSSSNNYEEQRFLS